jgi:glycosyltransferase involved in cell wall biosynthesis
MNKLSLKLKIFLLSSILIVFSIVVGTVNYFTMNAMAKSYAKISDISMPNLVTLYDGLAIARAAEINAISMALPGVDQDRFHKLAEEIKSEFVKFDALMKVYEAIPFSEGEKEIYDVVSAKAEIFKKDFDKIIPLLKKSSELNSSERKEALELINKDLYVHSDQYEVELEKLLKFHEKIAEVSVKQAKTYEIEGTFWSLFVIALSTIFGVGVTFVFAKSLVKSFEKINRKVKLVLWDLDIWPDTLVALKIIRSKKIIDFLQKIVVRIYKNYDEVLVSSLSFVDIIKKRVDDVKISYFPNWAEDVFINKQLIKPLNYVDIKVTGLKIMFAGNLGKSQDIESIFNTIINTKELDLTWIFIGDGRMKSWLEEKLKQNITNNNIFFLGNYPVKYMPYFFSKADIMLISLKDEKVFRHTVPAKLQSYLASGKPILGNLTGEASKIIIESKSGWVINKDKNINLTDLLKVISETPLSELKERGKNGYNYYNKKFDKSNRFNQLNDILFESSQT